MSEHDLQGLSDAFNAGVVVLDQDPESAFTMLHYWKSNDEPDDLDDEMVEALEDCED